MRPQATGKEDRARPLLFPVAGRAHRPPHWGESCGLGTLREQRGLTPHSPFVRPSLRYANGPFAAEAKARYDYLEKEWVRRSVGERRILRRPLRAD